MAQFIKASPTSHLHLLMGEPAVRFQILVNGGGDFSGHPQVQPSNFDPAKAQVAKKTTPTAHIEASPVAAGETIGKITFTEPTKTHVLLVRIEVHGSIDKFWIGNNKLTVPAPSVDPATSQPIKMRTYQLTVYARFNDGLFGDVTAHPYITFASDDDTIVHVDHLGRLEGRGTVGQKTNIKVTHKATTQTIEVKVGDPVIKDRKILKAITVPVPGGGTSTPSATNFKERRNFLFVAEGFTQAEEPEFNQWVTECINSRMFAAGSLAHSPFHLLGNGINVWTAFEPSEESGVSVGPPVKKSLNTTSNKNEAAPIPTNPANPVNETVDGFLQAKNCRYGFYYGGRTGERTSQADSTNWFNPPRAHRTLDFDPRRLGEDGDVKAFLNPYLESLQTAAGDKIGKERWAGGKPDEGLICILVNDDHAGGLNLKTMNTATLIEIGTFLSVAYGINRKLELKAGVAAPIMDHDPITTPGIAGNQFPLLDLSTDVISHELSHYMGLGDEYEDVDNQNRLELQSTDVQMTKIIDNKTNLVPFSLIDTGSKVDPEKLKWNWDRIELATVSAKSAVTPAGSQNTIEVELRPGQGTLWGPTKTAGSSVYLRHPDLNKVRPEKLFSFTSTAQFITDLNSSTLSAALRQEFTQKQITLSATASLVAQNAGSRWLITDNERGYAIRKGGNDLEVYSTIKRLVGPLTIDAINADVLTLKGGKVTGPGDFPQGSTIYLPKRASGTIQTLINANVKSFLASTGAVFEKTGAAACAQPIPDGVPTRPVKPTIPNFTFPRDWWTTIALYEGGGFFNCGVYRPTLLCRMRHIDVSQRRTFCFVCKYALVGLIDPTQLAELDREYP